jgi:hypothetical protein
MAAVAARDRQQASDPLALLVEVLAGAIRTLRDRDKIALREDLVLERARNAAMAVVGEFELRPREGRAPLLFPTDGEQVVALEGFAPYADPGVEVARLSIYTLASRARLTTAEASLFMAGLARSIGVTPWR